MKKFLSSLLICFTLTTVFTCSAFAADEVEPNNIPQLAYPMTVGNQYFGTLDTNDVDFYFLNRPSSGTQVIVFTPPDNQSYAVCVYDDRVLNSSVSVAPIAVKEVSNSQNFPVSFSFERQANTNYFIMVIGSKTNGKYWIMPCAE